jgi:geranylgeranyl diphosphate synthase type I
VQAGALLATDDALVIDAYRGFGWSLGIAFQLNDDLLGIWGDAQITGKEPSDLAKHKKTLPVIYALERAAESERELLRTILGMSNASPADIAEARAIIDRSGAREYTRERARAERDEALHRLETAGVVGAEPMERLRLIVVSAISA